MLSYNDARMILPDGGLRTRFQASAGVTAMRKRPEADATQVSQVLFGEIVSLHHESGEYALVQSELDNYVGWVLVEALSAPVLMPTHRIITSRLHTYSEPSVTAAANFVLGRGATLTATGDRDGRYLRFERAGWIAEHLVAPISDLETDPASVAEQLAGTPYLWGGRDCLGIDCSGLIQIAFGACGVRAPRDSDMQGAWFGEEIPDWRAPNALRRSDLIFWKGHVGMMLDGDTLLHSNGTFMTTMAEPLAPAIERIAKEYGEPIGARRIELSKSVGARPDWLTPPLA